jgi:hypothetical protein
MKASEAYKLANEWNDKLNTTQYNAIIKHITDIAKTGGYEYSIADLRPDVAEKLRGLGYVIKYNGLAIGDSSTYKYIISWGSQSGGVCYSSTYGQVTDEVVKFINELTKKHSSEFVGFVKDSLLVMENGLPYDVYVNNPNLKGLPQLFYLNTDGLWVSPDDDAISFNNEDFDRYIKYL